MYPRQPPEAVALIAEKPPSTTAASDYRWCSIGISKPPPRVIAAMPTRLIPICLFLIAGSVLELQAQACRGAAECLARAEALLARRTVARLDSAVTLLRSASADTSGAALHAALADAFASRFVAVRVDRWALDSTRFYAGKALAADPRSVRAIFANAFVSGAAGDQAEMIRGYERALEIDSSFARAAPLLVTAYDEAGSTERALRVGERLMKLQPNNLQLVFRYGWVLGWLWEQERAIELFTTLAARGKGGVYGSWARGELAYIARSRGEMNAAVEYMEAAVEADSTNGISRVGLATMLLDAGQPQRARPILERELARDSMARGYGRLPARLLLGRAAAETGDTAMARKAYAAVEQSLLARTAAGDDQSRYLAALYALQGRTREALDWLGRAVANGHRPYGGPDPRDGSFASLRGHPEYEELMKRAGAVTRAQRACLGLPERF